MARLQVALDGTMFKRATIIATLALGAQGFAPKSLPRASTRVSESFEEYMKSREDAPAAPAAPAAKTAPLVVDVEPVGAKPAASPFTADYVDVERREVELAARTALDALRSKGRGLDRATEEAAWEAAWIAASVSNLGQLKLKQDAAAHVSANIQPYVPPLRLPAPGSPEQDPRDPRFAAGRAPPGGYEQGPWDPRFEAGPGGDVRGYEQGAWDPRFEAGRAPPGMEGRGYAQAPKKQRFAGRRNYDQADAFAHGGPQPRRSRGGRNRWDSSVVPKNDPRSPAMMQEMMQLPNQRNQRTEGFRGGMGR